MYDTVHGQLLSNQLSQSLEKVDGHMIAPCFSKSKTRRLEGLFGNNISYDYEKEQPARAVVLAWARIAVV